MHKNLLRICLLSGVLLYSYSRAEERFSWLDDIKAKSAETSWWYYPIVVVTPRPCGGYIAFWPEREEIREELSFPPEYYYYRIIDVNGKIVVDRRELNFWRVAPHPTYFSVSFNSKSMLWLDTTKLLIIAWKSFGHQYKLERIIMNSNGEIVAGPDSVKGGTVSQDAMLVKDNKGRAYAVDYAYGLRIMQIYPEFSEVKSMPLQKYKEFREKYPAHTFGFRDPVVVITSDDKLLICSRVGWGYTALEERGIWQDFRSDEIFCILTNLEGNFIAEPVKLNIIVNAFHKIPGIHLGGSYSNLDDPLNANRLKVVNNDMDLSKLPNGDIVLSVTAPDKNGKLDVYQLKFTPEGKFIKPKEMEVVNTITIPKNGTLPVVKCVQAIVGGKDKWRIDLVQFGLDEKGNFYAEREVWREELKK